jgi:hypothetical protein
LTTRFENEGRTPWTPEEWTQAAKEDSRKKSLLEFWMNEQILAEEKSLNHDLKPYDSVLTPIEYGLSDNTRLGELMLAKLEAHINNDFTTAELLASGGNLSGDK